MNVNFEPIMRGLKSDIFEVSNPFHVCRIQLQKKKSWVKKCHLKFPFWLFEPLPNQPCRKDHAWAREGIWTCRHPLICNCSNHPFVKDHWETFKDKDAHTRDAQNVLFCTFNQKVQQFWTFSIEIGIKISALLANPWSSCECKLRWARLLDAHCSRDNITNY